MLVRPCEQHLACDARASGAPNGTIWRAPVAAGGRGSIERTGREFIRGFGRPDPALESPCVGQTRACLLLSAARPSRRPPPASRKQKPRLHLCDPTTYPDAMPPHHHHAQDPAVSAAQPRERAGLRRRGRRRPIPGGARTGGFKHANSSSTQGGPGHGHSGADFGGWVHADLDWDVRCATQQQPAASSGSIEGQSRQGPVGCGISRGVSQQQAAAWSRGRRAGCSARRRRSR